MNLRDGRQTRGMSTYSLASAGSGGAGGATTPPVADQGRALEEALAAVRVQAFHMKRSLDANKLMDALKHASTMLAELRTSSLMPKYYYELYMSIFDELRHLSTFLYDAHTSCRHHLSDLYELVQYAASIVPRLYLMVTVGAVFMRVSKETHALQNASQNTVDASAKPSQNSADAQDAPEAHAPSSASATPANNAAAPHDVPPIKELLRDMLEMARGVQHPTRGLFLRYYLSGLTRDFLPDLAADSPHGNIHDSIHFIIHNFIEMNKLWVRLQFMGHSRERDKREQERKELRLLVGSNLVRLSQLEDLSLPIYQQQVLPTLLDEIVSCRDVIAQEYLMEVIIQVFPDDFHLRCLDIFLPATAQLQRTVNVKQIVISLIDRFANYAARAREEAATIHTSSSSPASTSAQTQTAPESEKQADKSPSGIPDDVRLFDVFWKQITDLINARPEFTIQDIIALLLSLANLSLNCYPEELSYIDRVLGMAKEKVFDASKSDPASLADPKTRSLLLQLLRGPISTYSKNVLRILEYPSSATQTQHQPVVEGVVRSSSLGGNYTDLLFLQPYGTRREIAHAFATCAIRASINDDFVIDSVEGVNFLLGEVCSIMVRDQVDGGLFGPKRKPTQSPDPLDEPELPLDWDDAHEEQTHLAKLVHLIHAPDDRLHLEFLLLTTARNHFVQGGDIRIRFTIPPIVVAMVKLARKYHYSRSAQTRQDVPLILKTIHQTISSLQRAQEYYVDESDGVYGGGGRGSTSGAYKPLFKENENGSSQYTSSAARIGHNLMSPPDASLRLYLLSSQIADELGHEELCYEFFVQALTVYEESVSESKAQVAAMTQIIGTLYTTTVFGYENYETLCTKCAVHCSRLLKRVDQCRGVLMVSHLFWAALGTADDESVMDGRASISSASGARASVSGQPTNILKRLRDEDKPAYRDGKRVLECLQKSLKIADSVMDTSVNITLFVEILERYVWYYEHRNDMITSKYLGSLVELVQTNLMNVGNDASAVVGASASAGGGDLAAAAAAAAAAGVSGGPLSAFGNMQINSAISEPNQRSSVGSNANVPPSINTSRRTATIDQALTHFRNILAHMAMRRDAEQSVLDAASVVPGMSSGFAAHGGGRWGSIDIPRI